MPKILITDDLKENLRLYSVILEKMIPGISLVLAGSGEECLSRARLVRPDVIILDINMPGINGYETCLRLKEEKDTSNIPIILVTGFETGIDKKVKGLEAGADAFLTKPIEAAELAAQVKVMLRIKTAEDRLRYEKNQLEVLVSERTSELRESIKSRNIQIRELNCLFGIADIIENSGVPFDDMIQRITDIIPTAWQYSDKTCARMVLDGSVYSTSNFTETKWRQSSPINSNGSSVGLIDVCYLNLKHGYDAEVFLRTEKRLIEVIASRVGKLYERKKANEHIHLLSQELIKAQENERQRIARELHDNVAQDLGSLKVACDTLLDGEISVSGNLRSRLAKVTSVLKGAIEELRNLAHNLRPSGLDRLGLVKTIEEYCNEFSARTGIDISFICAGVDGIDIGFHTEINLYRVVQEAMNNIRKHANASRIAVNMTASFPDLILRIEDDGRGFDVPNRRIEAMNERRMGLQSMMERIKLLNGDISIRSQIGSGTVISIRVNTSTEKEAGQEQETKYATLG